VGFCFPLSSSLHYILFLCCSFFYVILPLYLHSFNSYALLLHVYRINAYLEGCVTQSVYFYIDSSRIVYRYVKFCMYKSHLPPNHLFRCEFCIVVDMKFESYFLILELRSRPALGSTQPIKWVPGVKRQGREADHSPVSAEVKKIWIYTYTPLYVSTA
jgi:hypothetical protein